MLSSPDFALQIDSHSLKKLHTRYTSWAWVGGISIASYKAMTKKQASTNLTPTVEIMYLVSFFTTRRTTGALIYGDTTTPLGLCRHCSVLGTLTH